MKKLNKSPKPLALNTEKVRDLQPLSDDMLRGIAGGQTPGGSSHTSGQSSTI